MNLTKRDQELIWHPFTQEKTAPPPIGIVKAKDSYLFDDAGNSYLDLISSWWVNLHGHCNPIIAAAVNKQATTLEHVMFAGFTHAPAVELCDGLSKILHKKLVKFFFADNGSTAVEVALKMAYQYWYNNNQSQRSLYLSFDGGYHGDTFGAMAVGKNSSFHDPFRKLMFDVISCPFPETWHDDTQIQQKEEIALDILKQKLTKHSDQIAAAIFEPLVQGASGMRMCSTTFLQKAIKLIKSHGILVICDEVMTGFGRLGSNLAIDQIDILPDFICLSKGITGGFLPLAVTVTTKEIYNAFYSNKWSKTFTHGHSYTANPMACAAGVASLDLLKNENTQKAIKNISQCHLKGIELLKEKCGDLLSKYRTKGTIAAFDMTTKKDLNLFLKAEFIRKGLLIRPLGNSIYLIPPYCTKPEVLYESYKNIVDVIVKTTKISN